MPISQEFSPFQQRVERFLSRLLADASAEPRLGDTMRYAVMGGGKRIRPLLVYGSALACSHLSSSHLPSTGEPTDRSFADQSFADQSFADQSFADQSFATLDAVAASVELVHCYSLVHDDLPAMDNDTLRRGQATCHLAFDEATAILAGDALLSLAFECLAQADIPAITLVDMIQILAKASGPLGMVGGQAADMAAIATLPKLASLEFIHQLKTGALIQAAVQLGAKAALAENVHVQAVLSFAKAIGLAFQIQDDVLDVVADTELMGKTQGADARQDKPTYVSLLGLKGAEAKTDALLDEAFSHLSALPGDSQMLRAMAEFIVKRDY